MASPVTKPRPSFASAFRRKPRDLFVKDVDCARGKDARGQRKMGVNRRGVRYQSVKRDERRNCGKDRQQRIKDDPSRDSKQSIVVDAGIDAPQDILPACPRDLPRRSRAPSPALLLRPTNLRRDRLVVFDLLPRPFVGIDLRRRRQFAWSFAALVRWGIGCPVRRADPFVQPADPLGTLDGARSLIPRAARGGDGGQTPVDQKRPYPPALRHCFARPDKSRRLRYEPAGTN